MAENPGFDAVADLYDEVRPGYAPAILEAIVARSGLPIGGSILEVGAGTGQIMVPMAEREYRIVALEPGPALARRCLAKCSAYPQVEVIQQRFEEFAAPTGSYDLVLSAQAFHWIEPATGIARAAEFLKPGGAIALVWHFDSSEKSAFYRATQPIYDRYFPSEPGQADRSLRARAEACARELALSPIYLPSIELSHDWTARYNEDTYPRLLQTHSPVLGLAPVARERFLKEIGEVIRLHRGTVERSYETYLLVARRASTPLA